MLLQVKAWEIMNAEPDTQNETTWILFYQLWLWYSLVFDIVQFGRRITVFLQNILPLSSRLKKEAVYSSEMLVTFYHAVHCSIIFDLPNQIKWKRIGNNEQVSSAMMKSFYFPKIKILVCISRPQSYPLIFQDSWSSASTLQAVRKWPANNVVYHDWSICNSKSLVTYAGLITTKFYCS